jgi:uncharacterized phage-associated protein
VWEDNPLFRERVEAWANCPVVPELYRHHRGQFTVKTWSHGDPAALSAREKNTVSVLGLYGDKWAFWLSELTHREAPWVNYRAGLGAWNR